MNSQRTHWVYGWVHCEQIRGYFIKEPTGFFHNVPSGHFDGYDQIKLMGSSMKYSAWTYWV